MLDASNRRRHPWQVNRFRFRFRLILAFRHVVLDYLIYDTVFHFSACLRRYPMPGISRA
jgi:hypothetical protein